MRATKSEQGLHAREAVEALADRLRNGGLSVSEIDDVADAFLELARHPRAEVRRAVAIALGDLRHEYFEVASSLLCADDNRWVRQAAEATRERRAAPATGAPVDDENRDVLSKSLAEHERHYGRSSRRSAERISLERAEILASEAYHELVKPLNALSISFERAVLALEEPRPSRELLKRLFRRMRGQQRMAMAILKTLREHTRGVVPRFRSENLKGMLTQAMTMVADPEEARRRRVRISITVPREDLAIEADRDRLLQAFRNVLQNSIEAFERHQRVRRISIEAEAAESRWVTIHFHDNGAGMSEEMRRKAFELFQSSKKTGLGYGLPLARKVVEREHGGAISIQSKEGEGTTVTIRLPQTQSEEPEP